jgi:hypothetical protein
VKLLTTFKLSLMEFSSFCVWSVGCYFGSYCNKSVSCWFLCSWNLWTMSVISWALWVMTVMPQLLLLSWKCCDAYIIFCCQIIYSGFSLCQNLGSDNFCCDGCVVCLANSMTGCFSERIWTVLGAVSFLCWTDITLGWGHPRSCSMALILDQLACAMFTHLSYG